MKIEFTEDVTERQDVDYEKKGSKDGALGHTGSDSRGLRSE